MSRMLQALCGLTLLVLLLSGEPQLSVLLFTVSVLWGLSHWLRPARPRLEINRTLPTQAFNGQAEFTVTLTVTNQGSKLHWLYLADNLPEGITALTPAQWLISLQAGETRELSYQVRARRGCFSWEQVTCITRDLLGLSQNRQICTAPGSVWCYPEAIDAARVRLQPGLLMGHSGDIPSRRAGSGLAFRDLRGYQPGDSQRHINWRASARHPGSLLVNQFIQEQLTEVVVLLDARLSSTVACGEHNLFEHAVSAAAGLSEQLLRAGHRVGLATLGASYDQLRPAAGRRQQREITRALAQVRLSKAHVLDDLEYFPLNTLRAGCSVIWISPLQRKDREPLKRWALQGYDLLIVSPDPAAWLQGLTVSAEQPQTRKPSQQQTQKQTQRQAQTQALQHLSTRRQLLVRGYASAGLQVLNWQPGTSLRPLLQQPRTRKAA